MKILMFGWEFPPFYAGGVGMVCHELTKAFAKRDDLEVTYVMPYGPNQISDSHVKILVANNIIKSSNIKIKKIPSILGAYMSEEDYVKQHEKLISSLKSNIKLNDDNTLKLYGKDLLSEVYNFAEKSKIVAEDEDFDIIHAHDWTTFPAAIAVKEMSGKPFIAHVHITEYDKSGGAGANPYIYAIEKQGMEKADKVIAVSNFVKQGLIRNYGINPDKIYVVHNANIEMDQSINLKHSRNIPDKIVLYAGRVTLQKGPEYFIDAAKKILEIRDDVTFIMAGTGDQLNKMIEKTVELQISDKFIFHGFYTRSDAEKFFSMADVFVMPSVSEPFGVVPLEAMCKGTPTIISYQSGCSEVLRNALKIDFWDIDQMANKIVSILDYSELNETLSAEGCKEVEKLNWDKPAQECIKIYNELRC